jgi:hypothetical protein
MLFLVVVVEIFLLYGYDFVFIKIVNWKNLYSKTSSIFSVLVDNFL